MSSLLKVTSSILSLLPIFVHAMCTDMLEVGKSNKFA